VAGRRPLRRRPDGDGTRHPRRAGRFFADTRAEQVQASAGLARVVWWEALSLGPFLLVPVLWGIAYVLWIVLWLAFTLLVKLPVYLLVLLPLSLLGLRRRPQPPMSLGPERDDPLRGLAPRVEVVDLDSRELHTAAPARWRGSRRWCSRSPLQSPR
jgi:hypothetical protein